MLRVPGVLGKDLQIFDTSRRTPVRKSKWG